MKKSLHYSFIALSFAWFACDNNLKAQTLSARSNNSIYICPDGIPRVWGYNGAGQFGNGTTGTVEYSPVVASGFTSSDAITDVSTGSGFSMFLKDDNSLWTCGTNQFGQTSHLNQTSLPTQVAGHKGITKIGTGFYHSFFIKNDNTVWAMGRNDKGQLGDGNITGIEPNPTPVQVLITDVIQVTGGFYHSIFLKSDGTVWRAGYTTGNPGASTPVQFVGLSDVVSIAAGQYFSLFLKNDGTVWVAGNNQYGQFGNGSANSSETDTPAQVPGLSGIVSIAAGDAFSLFVKNDGTVWACGSNDYGQLGDGTLIDRTSPVQVLGITNVASVAAGYKHSLFLKNDNTIWGCGYNLLGQLGDGTNVDALTPVQIIDLCQPISTGPIAPSNLTATPTNSIELNWQYNSNDEDGFYIESTQDTVGGTWTQIASVGSDITTYTHTGLTPGEDYFYRVRAYNSNGTSTFSNIAGATESVGINPLEDLSNSLNVYPNPSNGRITIELTNSSSIFDLVMTDISGKIILKQSNLPSKTEINLTNSMNGTYFIQFHTKSGIINKKITITQ